jgi:hypothetical protein
VATIERTHAAVTRPRLVLLVLGLLAVGAVVLLLVSLRRPPQMGADEAVFNTVDALFTAVTARDEKRLGQCEQRLRALKDAGKLPGDASDYLDRIVQQARAGRWQPAAERLYDFIRVQRREGPSEPRPKKDKKRGATK